MKKGTPSIRRTGYREPVVTQSDPDASSLVRVTGTMSAGPRITLTLFLLPVHVTLLHDMEVEINFGVDEARCDTGTALVRADMDSGGVSLVLGVNRVAFMPFGWLRV